MGAPKGNRNALKHGFYSRLLNEAEKRELEIAAEMGLDPEIALIRLKLRRAMEKDPDRLDLVMAGAGLVARLLAVRYRITGQQQMSLKDIATRVFADFGIPAGIKLAKTKLPGME